MRNLQERTPQEVFEEHLRLAQEGDLETDLERNYADDVVFLTCYGKFEGKLGAKKLALLLDTQLPSGSFLYTNRQIADDVAFLEWEGEGPTMRIRDGADSYVIRDGKIRKQTIHYRLEPAAPIPMEEDEDLDEEYEVPGETILPSDESPPA